MYTIDDNFESYLENYDGAVYSYRPRLKDLFTKQGREDIIEAIKDKHPKLKKALDKHPSLEKAVKFGIALESYYVAASAATLAAVGAYYAGTSVATTGTLAMFKPAMQATLKAKGKETNGLSLENITKLFLASKGKKSKNASSDFDLVSSIFGAIGDKVKNKTATSEDEFLNNLISGAINMATEKGANYVNDLITGNDAAKDTPLADEPTANEIKQTKDLKTTTETTGNKNMLLIFGAIVLILIFAKKG